MKILLGRSVLTSPNTATLPHYSPFRYPGGKTWLIPTLREWLAAHPTKTICEPFAGGASASLVAILEGYAEQAILIEKDSAVAAVWSTILSKNAEKLVDRILRFSMSRVSVLKTLSSQPRTQVGLAFQTILRNRCTRGGNLSNSAGLLVRGERDRGLNSRWYPETLAKRICEIHQHRDQIRFINGDGMRFLANLDLAPKTIKLFVDPPYPKLMNQGVRPLYNHCALDHEQLFEILQSFKGDFLLTYADCQYARNLAKVAGFRFSSINMRNLNASRRRELLIMHRRKHLELFK